jgi:predicted peptidase
MQRSIGATGLVLLLALMAAPELEARTKAKLLRESYNSKAEGAERDYFVYLPAGYKKKDKQAWPVMLFLHGNGERGDAKEDLDWVLVHGPLYEAWIQKRDLPFLIVAPQLPLYGFEKTVDYIRDRKPGDIPRRLARGVPPRPEEFATPTPMVGAVPDSELPYDTEGPPEGWFRLEDDLIHILDSVLTTFRADPDRVYLTGISYGGFGTWFMASRHPERFAAIAPVVGWGHPDLMPPVAKQQIPVWVFAGGRDPAVPVQFFYPGLNALEELGHPEVRFTIHEDMSHDTWRRVYAGEDLYEWLLSQRARSVR